MEPLGKDRLAGLDTLRAVAILAVMAFHLKSRLPDGFAVAGKFGWMGVDLFFVLSGYLIGSQLLKPMREGRGVDVLGFYRKRAYRILPAYLAVLAAYLVWPGWREDAGAVAAVGVPDVHREFVCGLREESCVLACVVAVCGRSIVPAAASDCGLAIAQTCGMEGRCGAGVFLCAGIGSADV